MPFKKALLPFPHSIVKIVSISPLIYHPSRNSLGGLRNGSFVSFVYNFLVEAVRRIKKANCKSGCVQLNHETFKRNAFLFFYLCNLRVYFMQYTLKYCRILSLRAFRFVKKSLGWSFFNNFFGIGFASLLDAHFFGSICLLLFRLFFRVFFSLNPFWYFNLFILLFGIILQLKYKLLNIVREFFVFIVKKLVGFSYWHQFTNKEYFQFIAVYGYGVEMPVSNIHSGSVFNKFWQKFFIFTILFRLWMFKHPILFSFCNFFLNCFLIFNQFFILSSFLSFFIFISRLYLYSSDFDNQKLFFIIHFIEKIENDEIIKPDWENAALLSLVVTRTYYDRNEVSIYNRGASFQICDTVYKRIIQINKPFKEYSEGLSDSVRFTQRYASHLTSLDPQWESGKPYFTLIKKEKRKKNSMFSLRKFPFYLLWYYNKEKTKFFDVPFPHLSEKAPGHPEYFAIFENWLLRSNGTTIKNTLDPPGLGSMPIKNLDGNFTGRAHTRTCSAIELKDNQKSIFPQQIQSKIEKQELFVLELPQNYMPNIHFAEIPQTLLDKPSCINFVKNLSDPTNLVLPEVFNCVSCFMNPFATKEQIDLSLEAGLTFLKIMQNSNHIKIELKERYENLYYSLKNVKVELTHLIQKDLCVPPDPFVQFKIDTLDAINLKLIEQPTKPPIPIIKKVIQAKFHEENDIGLLHFSNINTIPKVLGGEDKAKIVHRSLFPDLYQKNKKSVVSSTLDELALLAKKRPFGEPFDI